jgi:signal transduction histidine kinase
MNRTFDRVLLARHFALSVGALAAYVFRSELRIGYMALWIVGISASLNFLAYVFRTRPGMARICHVASPLIGVGGWTALIAVTNGVASPFIAGLWLEVVLSAWALQLGGIVWVTLGSGLALWAQQAWNGLDGRWAAMLLQSGFLGAMGLATFLVTRRWIRRQESMDREREALDERLDALNRELEDERVVAALGENVARLAHGLKNTVHSLRGFVRLIEPKLRSESSGAKALVGLRSAIDDLEALARLTLGANEEPGRAPIAPVEATPERASVRARRPGGVPPAIARALGEVTAAHPGVSWATTTDGSCPEIGLPESSFTEMLVILMRNAIEAMEGEGRAELESWVKDGVLHVTIADEGVGFPAEDEAKLFKPGYTTKPKGSGYGLFLARRIVEEQGGRITAAPREGRGAQIEVRLPIVAAEDVSKVSASGDRT